MKSKSRDYVGSTWYGQQFCNRDFTLATGKNIFLPSIGWKGRVPCWLKENLQTILKLNYETLHEMVSKQEYGCKKSLKTCNKALDNKPARKIG